MKDYMVRATAANAQIRAFACTTRETVETARASHNTSPVVTAALGRLLSAGAMMGSMLKGDDELITLQIKGDGPIGGLTVTADMNGHVKGYANVPDVILPANAQGKLDVGGAVGAGALSVIRDMGLKDPYVGQTELQTGEIAEDLTYYFAVSEQVPSVVGLGVLMNRDNTVRQALKTRCVLFYIHFYIAAFKRFSVSSSPSSCIMVYRSGEFFLPVIATLSIPQASATEPL